MRRRARPRVVLGEPSQPEADRIPLCITHGSPQMRLVNRVREESLLSYVSAQPRAGVEVHRTVSASRNAWSNAFSCLGTATRVDMIRHQAIGPDRKAPLLGILPQETKIRPIVRIRFENIRPTITSLGDMMCKPGRPYPRYTAHRSYLKQQTQPQGKYIFKIGTVTIYLYVICCTFFCSASEVPFGICIPGPESANKW